MDIELVYRGFTLVIYETGAAEIFHDEWDGYTEEFDTAIEAQESIDKMLTVEL